MYTLIKLLHISCAIVSISGFTARGLIAILAPEQLQRPWLKIAPHLIDTLLLGSAIYLAIASSQYPLQQDWLSAKLAALLLYIIAGTWVMRFARTQTQRITAYIVAICCFSYIFAVALTHSPTPWI